MSDLRFIGLLFSLALVIYFFYGASKRSRGELGLGLLVALGIALVSLDPAIADGLLGLFQLENRLFAVLVLSNLILFALFAYNLRQNGSTRDDLGRLIRMIAQTEYRRTHDEPTLAGKMVIVIPAYKEQENIQPVLESLPKTLMGYDVEPLVVVDGNYDHTEIIVKQLGHRVATHITNRGQGGALITGFEVAIAEGAALVVTMDADGQHRAEDLPNLMRPIVEGNADYVMGSRFMGEYADRGSFRHLGIILFSRFISLLTNTQITDCTNGYRIIRVEKLALMDLREERFNAPEMIIQAIRNGLQVVEVPVNIMRRASGESKKPPRLGYPLRFGTAIIKAWLR